MSNFKFIVISENDEILNNWFLRSMIDSEIITISVKNNNVPKELNRLIEQKKHDGWIIVCNEGVRFLEKVGLGERISHLPAELSGGEQQRVAIARALINEPQIIFADEPTGNLDSATSEGVMNLLLEIITETRKTLVVVTHDPRLAKQGDRKLTLTDGQIRQD